jgi:TolA-binding protein
MARGVAIALVIILAGAATYADAEDYYLYKPEKVQSKNIPAPGDGVLTKTIIIAKGDTLSRLSRRYGGRSSFFPQILLFNRIKNPDLIYAGDTLRVPLTRTEGGGATIKEKHVPTTKAAPSAGKGGAVLEKRRTPSASVTAGTAGKHLFKRGVRAYAKGHYRLALEIFDDYLAAYPNAPDAPEAALYQAECYMKLSGH